MCDNLKIHGTREPNSMLTNDHNYIWGEPLTMTEVRVVRESHSVTLQWCSCDQSKTTALIRPFPLDTLHLSFSEIPAD